MCGGGNPLPHFLGREPPTPNLFCLSQSGLAIAIDLASIAAIFVDRMSTRCSGEAALQNKSSLVPMLVVAVAVALIAGVTGWTIRSHADAKAAAGATENAAEGDMAAQIPTNPSQASHNAAAAQAAVASMPVDPAAVLAANNEASSKLIKAGENQLRSRYESEKVDAAWAPRKQQALEKASVSPQIEQLNAKPLSFAASCRSSTCLIGADFPNRVAADDWFTLYTLNAGPEMTKAAMQSSANPDGSVHLQIYGFARQ